MRDEARKHMLSIQGPRHRERGARTPRFAELSSSGFHDAKRDG